MTWWKSKDAPITDRSRYRPEMELAKGMHPTTLGRTAWTLAAAVAVLAVFNSQGLSDWSMKLPMGPVGDAIIAAAGWWHDQMIKIGAAEVRETIREGFRWFQQL
jgi:hypothetical protein